MLVAIAKSSLTGHILSIETFRDTEGCEAKRSLIKVLQDYRTDSFSAMLRQDNAETVAGAYSRLTELFFTGVEISQGITEVNSMPVDESWLLENNDLVLAVIKK